MASLAACSWPKPLVLVPCLSWSTASSVFTEVNYLFIYYILIYKVIFSGRYEQRYRLGLFTKRIFFKSYLPQNIIENVQYSR